MKDRIQEYMDYKNINAGELAVMLEVQRSNISHILNGRNKPSAAFIEKMLTVFPDLNARWLLTGQGRMLETTAAEKKENVKLDIQLDTPVSSVSDSVQEDKKAKVVIKADSKSEEKQKSISSVTDDAVDKVVLLFRDGTFSSFNRR